MLEANDPAIVAEVTAAHQAYESALVGNDIAVLDGMFWHSADAVRFGVAESLYGFPEIAAFRRARAAVDLARTVTRLRVVTFGRDTAVTTIEFERRAGDVVRHGRQTQVWRRLEEGWRIVSAHVSWAAPAVHYADVASALIGLPIPPEYRTGVDANVARARTMAQALLAFPLEETVAAAPVFRP